MTVPSDFQDKTRLKKLILSSIIFVGLFVLLRVSGIFGRPEEIVSHLSNWYIQYGYWVIFISALVEGIFVINLYFPGSTAILLGVALASQNELSGTILVALTILGFFLSYLFNYFLGRYGYYQLLSRFGYEDTIDGARASLIEKGPKIMLSSFFHPNLGSVITTGAGVIQMPFGQFVVWSLVSLIVWDTIWGIVVSLLGSRMLELLGSWLAIPFMIFWVMLIFVILRRQSGQKGSRQAPIEK